MLVLAGCNVLLEKPPAATPADFAGISGYMGNHGITVEHVVSGDAGCEDPTLRQTAIAFDAQGLDQATPDPGLRLHLPRPRHVRAAPPDRRHVREVVRHRSVRVPVGRGLAVRRRERRTVGPAIPGRGPGRAHRGRRHRRLTPADLRLSAAAQGKPPFTRGSAGPMIAGDGRHPRELPNRRASRRARRAERRAPPGDRGRAVVRPDRRRRRAGQDPARHGVRGRRSGRRRARPHRDLPQHRRRGPALRSVPRGAPRAGAGAAAGASCASSSVASRRSWSRSRRATRGSLARTSRATRTTTGRPAPPRSPPRPRRMCPGRRPTRTACSSCRWR